MRKARVKKIMLNGYGSILRMERGCYVVQNKKQIEKYPQFEEVIGEVVLRSGNTVTVGALASLCFWEIDTLILTRRGKPVGMLRSVEYNSHVKTRLCQYEAYNNDKTIHIGKQIVLAKIKGQNMVLRKHGLNLHKEPRINTHARRVLISIEGTHSKHYFNQIFHLFPKWLIPDTRKTYRAYDGLNNIFNLAYEILKWKVHIALIKAKLEPYLGFLHTVSMGNPSLVSDFQDLYRYLIDDFLIAYCRRLRKKDFIMKQETFSKKRKGKREYLTDSQTRNLVDSLYRFFSRKIEIPRIRGKGKKQRIETLINEEAFLFAKYLRDERKKWIPRIPPLFI